ncbi:undecaprenyl-phosphate glucose phosphotransferase [Salinisphaera orenii]|uniref:undecaprenyl-phosphate glucose phosphotransferase n=1 Tax=Salinisphaera orenii TaxID=856731 RepID=UPI000DBE04AD
MTAEQWWPETRTARWVQYAGSGALLLFAFFAVGGTSIALGALGIMLITALLDGRRFGRALVGSKVAWAVLALALYVAGRGLYAAWAQPAHAGAHYEALWHWLLLLFFPLTAWFAGSDSRRIQLVLAVALVGLLVGMARLSDWHQIARALAGSGERIDFGMTFLNAALYLGVGLLGWIAFIERLIGSGRWRWARAFGWLIVAAILGEMLFLTQSRAVLLSLIVLLPCLVLIKVVRMHTATLRRRGLAACLVLVVAIVVLGVLNRQAITDRAGKTVQSVAAIATFSLDQIPQSSLGQRVRIYLFGGETWLDKPVFGWGPGIEATEMLPGAPINPHTSAHYPDLHDGYLEVLVRFGVVGLALASVLALVLARGLYRGWRSGWFPEDMVLFFLAATLLAALVNLSNFRAVHEYYRYFTILLLGLMYGLMLPQVAPHTQRERPTRHAPPGLRGRVRRRQPLLAQSGFLQAVLGVSDVVAVIASGYVAYDLRFGTWFMPTHYRGVVVLGVVAVVVIFAQLRLYAGWLDKSGVQRYQTVLAGWGFAALALIVLGFVLRESAEYSRLWFGIWVLLGVGGLLVGRLLTTQVLVRLLASSNVKRRVVVVGGGAIAERTVRRARMGGQGRFAVCRVMPLDETQSTTGFDSTSARTLSTRISLGEFVERAAIDEVWFCVPLAAAQTVRDVQYSLRHSTVVQRLIPDLAGLQLIRHQVTDVLGTPALNLTESPMHGVNQLLKAIEDRVLATLILIMISPLFGLIAIAIKLDSNGSVFFTQLRHGWGGQKIKVHKFRTMRTATTGADVVQAKFNDPRVTRVGRFLRSTSLDELPQFWNVVTGDMSIVGPRPQTLEHNIAYREQIEAYMQRHSVKPGITGWAQIHGLRGETSTPEKMQKRIEYDLYYIEHWSLWLDIKIIALTPLKGFINKNAY